jgi:hypothetical protein
LGRHCSHEMAASLIEAFQGLRCRATEHYPKSDVYLQRDYHRVSPLFDFRGLEATNAPHGTKVPTGDQGQFKVVRRTITAIVEYPQVQAARPIIVSNDIRRSRYPRRHHREAASSSLRGVNLFKHLAQQKSCQADPAASSFAPPGRPAGVYLVQRKPRDVVRSVPIVAVGRLSERAGKLPFLGLVAPLNGGMANNVV